MTIPATTYPIRTATLDFGLADLAAKIDPESWARSGATLRLGEPPAQIDILLQLSGVQFRGVPNGSRTSAEGTTMTQAGAK